MKFRLKQPGDRQVMEQRPWKVFDVLLEVNRIDVSEHDLRRPCAIASSGELGLGGN
jgi:hypothetical protein